VVLHPPELAEAVRRSWEAVAAAHADTAPREPQEAVG